MVMVRKEDEEDEKEDDDGDDGELLLAAVVGVVAVKEASAVTGYAGIGAPAYAYHRAGVAGFKHVPCRKRIAGSRGSRQRHGVARRGAYDRDTIYRCRKASFCGSFRCDAVSRVDVRIFKTHGIRICPIAVIPTWLAYPVFDLYLL